MIHIKHKILTGAFCAMIATPALAIDDCALGSWEADYLTFGGQYMDIMNAQSVTMNGEVFMTIADSGIGTYLVDNLSIDITLEGVPTTNVVMNGTGEFNVTIDDGSFGFAMGAFAYDAVAKVAMPGGGEPLVMEIPVTDEMVPIGTAAGLYTCTDEVLVFEPIRGDDGIVGNIITKWFRQ